MINKNQAGINTKWIPGEDPVFETGLLYPAQSSGIVVQKKYRHETGLFIFLSPQIGGYWIGTYIVN